MPPLVTIWVQRKGDDMTGKGKMQYYRWWGLTSITDLKGGEFDVTISAKLPGWTSVFGNQTNEAGFAGCMNQPQRVGMTFGGGSFLGHGVRLTRGTAKFTLLAFEVV
jgi:hypothetical protein